MEMLAVRAEKASEVGQVGQGSSGLVTVCTSCRGKGGAKESLRLSREGCYFETIHCHFEFGNLGRGGSAIQGWLVGAHVQKSWKTQAWLDVLSCTHI